MLDAYKELTPVVYGENAIKYLCFSAKTEGMVFHMHWHDRMELLRVVSGQLELHLNEEHITVLPGQVVITSPRMMHCGFAGKEGVIYHTIMFDIERFSNQTIASDKYLSPISKSEVVFQLVTENLKVVEIVDRLVSVLSDDRDENPLFAIGVVYEIIGTLYQYCISNTKINYRIDQNFRNVLEYINKNYSKKFRIKIKNV